MKVFVFAELALEKKCFRVHYVQSHDRKTAQKALPVKGWGMGFIGSRETKSRKEGRRTVLIRSRPGWADLCRQFGLTAEQGEAAISKSYGGLA